MHQLVSTNQQLCGEYLCTLLAAPFLLSINARYVYFHYVMLTVGYHREEPTHTHRHSKTTDEWDAMHPM